MMTKREWTRRDFFRAAGIGAAGAALLPFVPIPAAHACGTAHPRCLVLFAHGNGGIPNRWTSNGTGTPFTNNAALPVMQGPILAPLNRHRQSLALFDGFDLRAGMLTRPLPSGGNGSGRARGHWGMATLWTGAQGIGIGNTSDGFSRSTAAAASIDQILAQGATTRRASLVLGTNYNNSDRPENYMPAYAGPNQPIIPRTSPRAVFDDLFGAPIVGGGEAAAQRRRAERRSLSGMVRGELGRLRTELPSVDRERLDQHLAQIEDLDERLMENETPVVCSDATRPAAEPAYSSWGGYNPELLTRLNLHFDLIRLAFACDLTRIVNLMYEHEHVPRLLVRETGALAGFMNEHTVTHETLSTTSEARRQQAIQCVTNQRRALADAFAGFLDRLATGPGPTLLSETLAVWGSGMSWGGSHVGLRVPFVVASGHASVRTNRYHQMSNKVLDVDAGVRNPHTFSSMSIPHNRLLTSIVQLMGRTDIERVGDPNGGQTLDNTPLTELCAGST
jgi:hypothetical protein